MQNTGKTLTAILFSTVALALGACGKEEYGAQAETVSLSEEDSTNLKEDSVLKEGLAERIKKVEEYCHVKFPDDYIIFIEEYNVGLPVANTFMANHKEYVIERFLGFVSDYQNSPMGEYDIAVVMAPIETYMTDNPDLVGADLIPIAKLTTGDYVCLRLMKLQTLSCILLRVWNK